MALSAKDVRRQLDEDELREMEARAKTAIVRLATEVGCQTARERELLQLGVQIGIDLAGIIVQANHNAVVGELNELFGQAAPPGRSARPHAPLGHGNGHVDDDEPVE